MIRRGRRITTNSAVVYWASATGSQVRFGFVVSKAVGNAVARNRVRRRLKAISSDTLSDIPSGTDVVIRALPGSASASWSTLNSEITGALSKGKARA